MPRIFAFSDLHHSRHHAETLVSTSQAADIVIGAGDFCNMRQGLPGAISLLADIKRPFLMVPGNAESVDELRDAAHEGMTVLHGDSIEVGNLQVFGIGYGIPKTPFGDWSCDLSEESAAEMLAGCDLADILVTHSPPKGVGDVTSRGVSVGSVAVRDAVMRIKPKLVLCGHIHDSWGQEGMIGDTRVVNLGPEGRWFDL